MQDGMGGVAIDTGESVGAGSGKDRFDMLFKIRKIQLLLWRRLKLSSLKPVRHNFKIGRILVFQEHAGSVAVTLHKQRLNESGEEVEIEGHIGHGNFFTR